MKKSFICQTLNKISKHSFNTEEKKNFEEYISQSKYKNSIEPNHLQEGMWVDVRDTLFVWCKAIVNEIIEPKGVKNKILKIHYIGWSSIYDEFIPANSSRIAKLGSYTDKENIAKYQIYYSQLEN